MLNDFIARHRLGDSFRNTAQKWFNPLLEQLLTHYNSANKPFIVGVNGCQGSGKSTMSDYLYESLKGTHGLNVAVLSLDDFYLTKEQRAALAIKVHPLLKTRGVPGTHNTSLLSKTLDRLSQFGTVSIPRFNKAIDNPYPVSEWPSVHSPVDVILLEGWCWGVTGQSTQQLSTPVNALEQQEDALGVWRHYVNQQLIDHYQPLYERMDYWVMLKAPSFDCVYTWRCEQEHKLALSSSGKDSSGIMSDEQIERFIQYYQRLTEHALSTLADSCDCVFELDAQRNIVNVGKGDA